MSDIRSLLEIDFKVVFIGLFAILAGLKACTMLVEWLLFDKLGIETKWMREKRQDHETTLANTQAIRELADIHKRDNEISNEHDDELRDDLSHFIMEVRGDIGELKTSMQESFDNSLKYRQVSIDKEKRLDSRIDTLVEASKQRDISIEIINNNLDKLTKMLVDGQINDMRHRILNFAASVSAGKKYNMEAYEYILGSYTDYERILEEHGLTNGLVEESIGFIRSSYQEHLKKGDFGNYRL